MKTVFSWSQKPSYFKSQIGYTYVVFYILKQAALWQIESETRLFSA